MKKMIILLFILYAGAAACQEPKIVSIEFYYLPWEMRTVYNISAEDVRDFNKGKNMKYTIENDTIIDKICHTLLFFKMKFLGHENSIDTRMVMDFCFDDGTIKTVCLNTMKWIYYNNCLYHSNYWLSKLLEEYLPPAKYQ
jgi:hypothetical protein